MRKVVIHLSAVIDEQVMRDLIQRAILVRNTGATLDSVSVHSPTTNLSIVAEITLPRDVDAGLMQSFMEDAIKRCDLPIVTTTFMVEDSMIADLQAKKDKALPLAAWETDEDVDARLTILKAKKAEAIG